MPASVNNTVRIAVPANLSGFLDTALARLGYLHPMLVFERRRDEIIIIGAPSQQEAELRRDVLYALYREKIYAETLPMRQALLGAVTGL